MEKYSGLIFDDSSHYIDHLAPFCSLMGWPLIIHDPELADVCHKYYPNVEIIRENQLPNSIVSCYPRALLEDAFPYLNQSHKTIWLPHGHSDKGWNSYYFESLEKESLLLVYGERMKQVLQIKGVDRPTCTVGSFRKKYFESHQQFYNDLLNQMFGNQRFILYAPSWEDSEQSGTFWDLFPHLSLPSNLTLVIKLHPNTERLYLPQIERAIGLSPKNVHFVQNFPPIYPLLSRADAYIGDRSSIGYDFLHFNKPLFFATRELIDPCKNPSAYLMQSGEQVLCNKIASLLLSFPAYKRTQEHEKAARLLLEQTFDQNTSWPLCL